MCSTGIHATRTVRVKDALATWNELCLGACCSLVGASNSGKSTLLRALGDASRRLELAGDAATSRLAVYVDLNMMVGLSENAFYELVLRNVVDVLLASDEAAAREVAPFYEQVAAQPPAFTAALKFNEGLIHLVERSSQPVALFLDEFDEPFVRLDARVFLNLRALVDRYQGRIVYAVATNAPLADLSRDRDVGEFCELFDFHTRYLGALSTQEAGTLLGEWSASAGLELGARDLAFLSQQAGGHVGLLLTAARVYGATPHFEPTEAAARALGESDRVRTECAKLWGGLTPAVHQALLSASDPASATFSPDVTEALARGGLLREGNAWTGLPALFRGFVERLALAESGERRGVRVDVERGQVWVDGRDVPALTDLEYRLLLMLYGKLDRICDKFAIVETVWGQSYVDEVDDARIDKLVSRLRQKLEPNPDAPRYLITVRGRGYKLTSSQ
jgi:hypothetical protein